MKSAEAGARGKTMSRRLDFTSAIRAASMAAAVVAVVGCSDRSNSIMGVTPPAQTPTVLPTGNLGVVMGAVDENGNVTLTPLQGTSGDLAPGIDGSIYGTQNVNVRVYAAAATVSTIGSQKTWTMRFGVRNLLSFPIGSNQAGPVPTDTTGVFLAVINGPTVTQTTGVCSPCAMRVAAFDGTGTFTAPNQPYVHWTERLSAKQLVASTDTVSQRRTIAFTSPLQVTNFTFFLIVGADWPAPNQTSWSLFYNAPTDSAPDLQAKPLWRTGTMSPFGKSSEVWSKAAGADSLEVINGRDYYLFRRDSLAQTTPAYIEASVAKSATNQGTARPETVLGFLDGTRMAAIGLTNTSVGFVRYAFLGGAFRIPQAQFIGGVSQFPVSASTAHTYLLRKFGSDSAVLYVDGTRRLKATYSQLPKGAQIATFTTGPAEFFGDGSVSGNANSAWSFVTYGIGASQP